MSRFWLPLIGAWMQPWLLEFGKRVHAAPTESSAREQAVPYRATEEYVRRVALRV